MTRRYRYFDADSLRTNPLYCPQLLLDTLLRRLNLANDAALSRLLEVQAPIISKIRSGTAPIQPWLLMRAHHLTGLSIDELRLMIGDSLMVDDGNP